MPSRPAWFQRVSTILATLEGLDAPYVDRKSVEELFGVRERRARQIMTGLPGIQVGNAAAVKRVALIGRLRELAAGDGYSREMGRRERVWAAVRQASRDVAAKNVTIRAEPVLAAELPAGVSIGAGILTVQFEDAEELAGRLYEISQWMAADWEAFCQIAGERRASLPSLDSR